MFCVPPGDERRAARTAICMLACQGAVSSFPVAQAERLISTAVFSEAAGRFRRHDHGLPARTSPDCSAGPEPGGSAWRVLAC